MKLPSPTQMMIEQGAQIIGPMLTCAGVLSILTYDGTYGWFGLCVILATLVGYAILIACCFVKSEAKCLELSEELRRLQTAPKQVG